MLGVKGGKRQTDTLRYPLDALVGLVDMEIHDRNGVQEFGLINNGQEKRFRSKAKNMTPTAVTNRQRQQLRDRQKERENSDYYRTFKRRRV